VTYNDPIDELIDKQLASLSLELLYVTRKASGGTRAEGTKGTGINNIEDMFIDAYDKKYNRSARRQDAIKDLLIAGYEIKEIQDWYGITRYTLRRDIEKLKKEHADG